MRPSIRSPWAISLLLSALMAAFIVAPAIAAPDDHRYFGPPAPAQPRTYRPPTTRRSRGLPLPWSASLTRASGMRRTAIPAVSVPPISPS